jgi:hypothetical protein
MGANRLAAALTVACLAHPALAWDQSETESGTPLAWRSSCVYWTITEQDVDNSHFGAPAQPLLTFEDLRGAVRCAVAAWDDVEGSYMRLVETEPGHCFDIGYHANAGNANRVFFRSSGWVDPDAPWRAAEQIALTSVFFDTESGEILDVDIEVNAEHFELTTAIENPRTDICNALTHEVGHVLGLDHSTDPEATMYRSARTGETSKRDLNADDIAGISAIYPVADDPDRCEEPRGGLDVGCETATWCADPVDGVIPLCAFDEPVCCCERAGGLGACRWQDAGECLAGGRHGVLLIDQATACAEERPGRDYLCCCHTERVAGSSEEEYTTTCSWERVCQRPETEAAVYVNDEVLCGTRPASADDCSCSAPGSARRRFTGLIELIAGWMGW